MFRLGLARIRALIKVAAESGVAEVEIEEKGVRILVRQQAQPVVLQTPYMPVVPPPVTHAGGPTPPGYMPQIVPTQANAQPAPKAETPQQGSVPQGTVVRAPIVGTFFRRSAPDAAPYVEVGSMVAVGDTLCIIEAMKNMNEIDSEVAGTIKEILVQDAEAVSYDQPLFVIT